MTVGLSLILAMIARKNSTIISLASNIEALTSDGENNNSIVFEGCYTRHKTSSWNKAPICASGTPTTAPACAPIPIPMYNEYTGMYENIEGISSCAYPEERIDIYGPRGFCWELVVQ